MPDKKDKSKDTSHQEEAVFEKGTGKKKIPGHIIINTKEDTNAKWYVVHTSSGHEARVSETLRQRVETMKLTEMIFELLVPTQDRVVIRSGRKAKSKKRYFQAIYS